MFGHLHTTIECHFFCVGERGLTHIMKWENFHITVISDESSPNGDWLLLCCFCGWFGFTNTTYWLKLGSMAFCLELAEDIEESFRLATNWMRRLFPSNYALWSPYGSFFPSKDLYLSCTTGDPDGPVCNYLHWLCTLFTYWRHPYNNLLSGTVCLMNH